MFLNELYVLLYVLYYQEFINRFLDIMYISCFIAMRPAMFN